VSGYHKGKTNLDFTGARDSERQWNRLSNMQVRTKLQTDNHASTSLLSFLQAGRPFCHPTNSVKALKAEYECQSPCDGSAIVGTACIVSEAGCMKLSCIHPSMARQAGHID